MQKKRPVLKIHQEKKLKSTRKITGITLNFHEKKIETALFVIAKAEAENDREPDKSD
jgi:hypothetical protein